jgi:hypothetical protein
MMRKLQSSRSQSSRSIGFLLTAAVLFGAAAARADVRPPVTVRILGEARPAQAGVPFEGRLQIESGVPAIVGNLKFAGTGWDQLSLAASAEQGVDKDRPLIFDFSVVTVDPEQPLELTFEFNGAPMTRRFDLSPAFIASLLTPGTTTAVTPTGDVPPLTDETRISPEPPPFKRTAKPGPVDPDKSRTVRVHGRLVYQRADGATIGADGVDIYLHDNNVPFPSDIHDTGVTNAQGFYDLTFTWTPGVFDAEPDIYVEFSASSVRTRIHRATYFAETYIWETATTWDYTGSDLDLGWQQPSDLSQHPALHLMTTIMRTWRWWYWNGYETPSVLCEWPSSLPSDAYYDGQIHIGTDRQWNEDTITHEYAHHWVESFALSPAPFYCNGMCDDPGCGHCVWCPEDDNIAFTEGFPDWAADIIPRSFADTYGVAALAARDVETLGMCLGTYADPLTTEGFLAAVVRDIGDAANDDHPAFPESDTMSLGWGPILACIDLDAPTTAWDFLAAFRNRYPAHSEALWSTAKNCGYEIDMAAPAAVTGLYSTSHSLSVASNDATIDLAWSRAVDDVSGVTAYGITIAGGIGLPEAVVDLGDVTSYTTPVLAPGSYYFSIRALDRSGKWSGAYAWSGPYVVRSPLAANLAFYQFPGWARVALPRPAPDASFASVPEPTTLTGDSESTWVNVGMWNSGEVITGANQDFNFIVDGDVKLWGVSPPINPSYGQYLPNGGPISVRGGRHTFESRLDATEQNAESNENDNRWAHQWVWNPTTLPPDVPVVRAAPPRKTAGWDAVTDGSTLYANVDGLRMSGASWWDVAVLRPLSPLNDRDLTLFAASSGASDGFATPLAGSYSGSNLDAVIVNHNWMGWGTPFDVGVENYDERSEDYEITHVTTGYVSYGDSITVAYGQDQMLRIWEFYVSPDQVGPVSITVDTAPANGMLHAQWLNSAFQTGGLYSPSYWANSNAAGRARMELTIPNPGFNALLVYRDPNWTAGNLPIDVTIEISRTPPDFIPMPLAGWHAPVVPRTDPDGTAVSVPAPTILYGNTWSTYFNAAIRNHSAGSSPQSVDANIEFDGETGAWVGWGPFPASTTTTLNWDFPFNIRGGRHMLTWKTDYTNANEEIHEDNNAFGEQWVWSPLDLVNYSPVERYAPPNPYGGWTNLSTAEPFYPNCDGLRMPNAGGYWHAVATMPTHSGDDVDLRLHAASDGAKSGFTDQLAGSYWGGDASDHVLVNFNLAPGGMLPYDVGALRAAGTGTYVTESTATGGWLSYPDGIYGPYAMANGRILNLLEMYLTAGQLGIHLMNVDGTVDWGVTLHRADLAYQGKSEALGTSFASGGAGGNELLVIDVPADGYYCLAVWKRSSVDLWQNGSYNLLIKPMWASGVDPDVPSPRTTALVEITPNPFNPQTKITYDLAREAPVQLEVYDVQGRLVRTLVDGNRSAGRHVENWNGTDDNGGRVASGMYLARLKSDGVTGMMKMMLLK